LPRAYHNIRAAKLSSMLIRTQAGCVSKKFEGVSSFQSNDDFYSAPTNYRHNYSAKQNISSSFDLKTLYATHVRGGHRVLCREGERVEAREMAPAAFILSDQNFPPSLPVETEGQ
jgi:hypothetical protein